MLNLLSSFANLIYSQAANIGNFIYDYLPSYSEVSQVDLAGSMEAISWTDAVA